MAVTVRSGRDPELACELLQCTPVELAEREELQPVLSQWFAFADDRPVGFAWAASRPDGRTFLRFRIRSEPAWRALLATAAAELGQSFSISLNATEVDRIHIAQAMGLTPVFASRSYAVPFESALASVRRSRSTTDLEVVRADQVDQDELYLLDVALRQDVPGLDGWAGDRRLFDDEMNSPEFDPTGYLVAITGANELIGLVRFWRNSDGPSLGLLGVTADHRRGVLARELLRQGLLAASTWGSVAFATHTARPALQRRLERMGATETGRQVRLRWSP